MTHIDCIANRIAEQVAQQGNQGDADAWRDRQDRILSKVGTGLVEHRSPVGIGRLHAQAQEAETRDCEDQAPRSSVAMTTTVVSRFGRMCRVSTRPLLAPTDWAAST